MQSVFSYVCGKCESTSVFFFAAYHLNQTVRCVSKCQVALWGNFFVAHQKTNKRAHTGDLESVHIRFLTTKEYKNNDVNSILTIIHCVLNHVLGDVVSTQMHYLISQWPGRQVIFIFPLNQRKNGNQYGCRNVVKVKQ